MAHLTKHTFVCLDLETTGLDCKQDRIIELAVAKFTFDGVLEGFETLINPEIPIPQESVAIHHITQEMIQDKPTIREILATLLDFIGDLPIVGHGIPFDINMIKASAERLQLTSTIHKNLFFDTLRLARLYGRSPTNSLEMLRQHFNIQEEGAHRAMSDVVVNIQVFKHLTSTFTTLEDVVKALSKPIQMKHMPLGKHKGREMKELPLQYLFWAAKQEFDEDLLFTIRSEIGRRKKGATFGQAVNPFMTL